MIFEDRLGSGSALRPIGAKDTRKVSRTAGWTWVAGSPRIPSARILPLALIAAVALVGCDQPLTDSRSEPTREIPHDATLGSALPVAYLSCSGDVSSLSVRCSAPGDGGASPSGPSSALIVGNQGVYVNLTSSNTSYNDGSGQFTFDVTIENLIPQPLGTADGTTLHTDGVRIFFHSGPEVTGGSGTASVVPDGFGTFTAAGQAYYQYGEIVAPGDTSAARTWTLVMPNTVTTFTFGVYVAAEVPYPDGYVDLGPDVNVQATDTHQLTGTMKTPVGNPMGGDPPTIEFSSSDTAIAIVDETGMVTAKKMGQVTITATSGSYSGETGVTVDRYEQVWVGDVSTDWGNGANWSRGVVPTASDSARVPVVEGGNHYPQLTSNSTVARLEVDPTATVSIGAFNLTINGDMKAGTTGGVSGTSGRLILAGAARTVEGRVGELRVTGTYSLAGDVYAPGQSVQIHGGRLISTVFRLRNY